MGQIILTIFLFSFESKLFSQRCALQEDIERVTRSKSTFKEFKKGSGIYHGNGKIFYFQRSHLNFIEPKRYKTYKILEEISNIMEESCYGIISGFLGGLGGCYIAGQFSLFFISYDTYARIFTIMGGVAGINLFVPAGICAAKKNAKKSEHLFRVTWVCSTIGEILGAALTWNLKMMYWRDQEVDIFELGLGAIIGGTILGVMGPRIMYVSF
ncbi:MAG: hypothetical protein ABDH37_08800 [Candidatus Hydrothermales bacterium]